MAFAAAQADERIICLVIYFPAAQAVDRFPVFSQPQLKRFAAAQAVDRRLLSNQKLRLSLPPCRRFQSKSRWLSYQKRIQAGLLEHKVTPKGLAKLAGEVQKRAA